MLEICIRREAAAMHEQENTACLRMRTHVCVSENAACIYIGCPLSVRLPYGNLNHIIFTLMATSLRPVAFGCRALTTGLIK